MSKVAEARKITHAKITTFTVLQIQSMEAMTLQKKFFAFQRFGYHISVRHDEKHPQPKFGGNQFMGARDMAAWIPNQPHWNQCNLAWFQINSPKKVSPHQKQIALLQKWKTQKYFCLLGHMRWSFSFDLIPYLRKISVK